MKKYLVTDPTQDDLLFDDLRELVDFDKAQVEKLPPNARMLTRTQVHDFALHIANNVHDRGWINSKVLGDALATLFGEGSDDV